MCKNFSLTLEELATEEGLLKIKEFSKKYIQSKNDYIYLYKPDNPYVAIKRVILDGSIISSIKYSLRRMYDNAGIKPKKSDIIFISNQKPNV